MPRPAADPTSAAATTEDTPLTAATAAADDVDDPPAAPASRCSPRKDVSDGRRASGASPASPPDPASGDVDRGRHRPEPGDRARGGAALHDGGEDLGVARGTRDDPGTHAGHLFLDDLRHARVHLAVVLLLEALRVEHERADVEQVHLVLDEGVAVLAHPQKHVLELRWPGMQYDSR